MPKPAENPSNPFAALGAGRKGGYSKDEWDAVMAAKGIDESIRKAYNPFALDDDGDGDDSVFVLNKVIGSDIDRLWGDLFVVPNEVRAWLARQSGDVKLIVNSPGGAFYSGIEIYAMLAAYDKGEVSVEVQGLAASAAAILIMGASAVHLSLGSQVMVHRAWTFAIANAEELEKLAKEMYKLDEGQIDIFVKRTGLKREKVEALLGDETFMSADDAVKLGFADGISEPAVAPADDAKAKDNEASLDGKKTPADNPPEMNGATEASMLATMSLITLNRNPR